MFILIIPDMEELLDVKIGGAVAMCTQKYPVVRILYKHTQHVCYSECLPRAEWSQQKDWR